MSVLRYSKTLSYYYYFVVPVLSEQTVFSQDGSKSLSRKSKSDIDIKTKFISLLLRLSCMGLLIQFILFFFLGSVYYQRMLSWNRSNHKKMVDFKGSGKESQGKMKKMGYYSYLVEDLFIEDFQKFTVKTCCSCRCT